MIHWPRPLIAGLAFVLALTLLNPFGMVSRAQQAVQVDKTAFPLDIACGGESTVTLTVNGFPSPVAVPLDIMLVIDRSGSMDGQKIVDAKQAANSFLNLIDFSVHRVGIVSFSDNARLDIGLTTNKTFLSFVIGSFIADGQTDIGDAIKLAQQELATNGRAGATKVMVLMSDGLANMPLGIDAVQYAKDQASQAKQAGTELFSIGLGADADQDSLRNIASAPVETHYFFAPDSSQLQGIYNSIAIWLTTPSLTLWDTVAPQFTIVPGSITPQPDPRSQGNTLVWRFGQENGNNKTFTYRVKHNNAPPGGLLAVNTIAELQYTDPLGIHKIPFPQPKVNVNCAAPNADTIPPTTTATLSPQPNQLGWNNTGIVITLTASDNHQDASGVKEIHYKVGAGQEVISSPLTVTLVYQTTFGLAIEGITTTLYWGVDNAGNVEQQRSLDTRIDMTPPAVAAMAAPAPNQAGWNNTNVTVAFTATDNLSGVASVDGPVTATTEGAGQRVTGNATDKAGNIGSAELYLNIDKTPPAVTAKASPAPNQFGWNNSDVLVSFSAVDALSGIASVDGPTTVTGEGANKTATGKATDKAGNVGSGNITLNIDRTPPTTSAILNPAQPDGGDGWYKSNVQVTLQASDNLSGISRTEYRINGGPWATYVGPFVVGTEGPTTAGFRSTDKADNVETEKTVDFKIDKTPPTVTVSSSPVSNLAGWNRSDVVVSFSATDALSGVASVDGPVTLTLEGNSQTVVGKATDKAGNQGSASATVSIDKTPPNTAAALDPSSPNGDNGWYRSNVTVTLNASDNLAGVAKTEYRFNGDPWTTYASPFVVSREGSNRLIFGSTDRADNVETERLATIKIDKTPPVITIASPGAGSYPVSGVLNVSFSASDSVSGLAWATGSIDGQAVSNGTAVDLLTLGLGTHTFIVWAKDNAGNLASQAVTFNVVAPCTIPDTVELKHRFFDLGLIDNYGIVVSLDAKLDAAQAALDRGRNITARNILYAFINETKAQSGKHITIEAADALIAAAQCVIDHI